MNANVINLLCVVYKDEEDICTKTLGCNILLALVLCILAVQNYPRVGFLLCRVNLSQLFSNCVYAIR